MVMLGRSVNQTFHGKALTFMHILSPVTDNCPSLVNGRREKSMWPDWVSNSGPLALESDPLPTALGGPAMCVCVCVGGGGVAYTVMSPVGNSTLKKIIAIFSGGKNYYMYREKLPYLSSG